MSERFELSKPIRVHDEEITVLEYRAPTPDDVEAVGELPYRMQADSTIQPLPAVCIRYLSKMAGMPVSSIKQMALTDINKLCFVVAGFFWDSGQTDPMP